MGVWIKSTSSSLLFISLGIIISLDLTNQVVYGGDMCEPVICQFTECRCDTMHYYILHIFCGSLCGLCANA